MTGITKLAIRDVFVYVTAERMLGINHTNIGRCANGKSKTAGGYIWEYIKGGVV